MQLIKRIESFTWRYGLFVMTSVGIYLGNVANIQDISWQKLASWFSIITLSFIGNEITKYMNSQEKPLEVKIVDKSSDVSDGSE